MKQGSRHLGTLRHVPFTQVIELGGQHRLLHIGTHALTEADPSHYEDSRNVVAVNRRYAVLKEKAARLTAEWKGLISGAERIDADYRRRWEELTGGSVW
ncbi:MAG: hypothetical protein ACLFVA_02040 [Dehalococcoidia bacterium]